MKKSNNLRISIFNAALVLGTIFVVPSCESNNNESEDPKEVAEELNEEKLESRRDEKDAQFLVEAADISLVEVKLGQLAQKNGKAKDVKEMGKMMESEHNKILGELNGLANQKSVTVPTSTTENAQENYQKLSGKTLEDFDKEYCEMLVKGHKDAISLFEKASTSSSDAEIQAWALATLPALREHLDHAIACQDKLK